MKKELVIKNQYFLMSFEDKAISLGFLLFPMHKIEHRSGEIIGCQSFNHVWTRGGGCHLWMHLKLTCDKLCLASKVNESQVDESLQHVRWRFFWMKHLVVEERRISSKIWSLIYLSMWIVGRKCHLHVKLNRHMDSCPSRLEKVAPK